MRIRARAIVGPLVLIGASAALAFDVPVIDDWLFRISTLILLTVSWNMMATAGMISLGQSAFWGLGSYVALFAVGPGLVSFGPSFLPSLAAGALAGTALALATGRLRGVYFAIATLALSEGLRVLALMLPGFSGGASGMFMPQAARPQPLVLYYTSVGLAAASVGLSWALGRTRIRYAMRAMRDNEDAAQMLGLNPLAYRVLICCIAGAVAAAGGALDMWYSGYVTPDLAFNLQNAILPQIAAIIGGVATLEGPVAGSFVVILLSETTRIWLGGMGGYSQLTYGVLLLICVLWLPRGLAGRRLPRPARG